MSPALSVPLIWSDWGALESAFTVFPLRVAVVPGIVAADDVAVELRPVSEFFPTLGFSKRKGMAGGADTDDRLAAGKRRTEVPFISKLAFVTDEQPDPLVNILLFLRDNCCV